MLEYWDNLGARLDLKFLRTDSGLKMGLFGRVASGSIRMPTCLALNSTLI